MAFSSTIVVFPRKTCLIVLQYYRKISYCFLGFFCGYLWPISFWWLKFGHNNRKDQFNSGWPSRYQRPSLTIVFLLCLCHSEIYSFYPKNINYLKYQKKISTTCKNPRTNSFHILFFSLFYYNFIIILL